MPVITKDKHASLGENMMSAKQGSVWYHLYEVIGMTRSGIELSASGARGVRSGTRPPLRSKNLRFFVSWRQYFSGMNTEKEVQAFNNVCYCHLHMYFNFISV